MSCQYSRHIVEVTDLVIPLNSRFTGYPEVGTAKPAPASACGWCLQMEFNCLRWHNLFVADVNIDNNAVLRLRIFGHAACRALFTICVSCATVASATAVRNAGRKRGGGSDITPTVVTSKVN
jgi:hypothetical protein